MTTLAAPSPSLLAAAVDTRARRWRWLLPSLAGLVLTLVVVQLLIGAGNVLTPLEAWRALIGAEGVPPLDELAVDVRLPRAILGLLAGAALGAAGALLQALTRNPLASPDLTGVTAGAVAAAVSWSAFGPTVSGSAVAWVLPLVATAGGLAAAAVVYLLTRRAGAIESTRLLLMGILVGGVLTSVTTLALMFMGPDVQTLVDWLSGSLSFKTWDDVVVVAAYVVPGLVLVALAVPRGNALQLGDDVARALGQRRERDRFLVLMPAVVLTAGVVAVVGAIGFVGLIGPHMVRRAVGSDLRRLVPAAALAGSVMVLGADLLARTINVRWFLGSLADDVRTSSLPVGIYLTIFGIPFLISLLWRREG